MWVQQLMEFVSFAESAAEHEPGQSLKAEQAIPVPEAAEPNSREGEGGPSKRGLKAGGTSSALAGL